MRPGLFQYPTILGVDCPFFSTIVSIETKDPWKEWKWKAPLEPNTTKIEWVPLLK